MNTGNRIKILRKEAKISQAELAKICGISQANISQIEKNLVQNTKVLCKIAKFFKVPEVWLKFGDDPEAFVEIKSPLESERSTVARKIAYFDIREIDDTLLENIAIIILDKLAHGRCLTMMFPEKDQIGKNVIALKVQDTPAMQPPRAEPNAIYSQDTVLVDLNKTPESLDIVLAKHKGSYILRQYFKESSNSYLKALNDQFPIIMEDFEVKGVVLMKITELKK